MKLSQIVCMSSHPKGTLVKTTTKHIIVPMSLRRTVNELCLVHGSSLEGRIAFAKTVTGKQRLLPIYVSSKCILLPSGSLKSYDTVLTNWFHLSHDFPLHNSSVTLEKAHEIAGHETSDYAILQVLKGSQIHE